MLRTPSAHVARDFEYATMRKMYRRLIPFLCGLQVASYLDRINVGFAQLQMKSALGFSDSVYGLGAGIFFIGYFFFEVPSNLILARTGARVWIARIMVTWGVVSSAMVIVRTPAGFYALRFLLGVAEAGFFPHGWLHRQPVNRRRPPNRQRGAGNHLRAFVSTLLFGEFSSRRNPPRP